MDVTKEEIKQEESTPTVEQQMEENPAATALGFFLKLYPNFKNKVGSCNNKDLRRLTEALVGWPLVDNKPPHLHSREAKDAWQMATALMQARQIMLMNVQLAKVTEAQAEKTETNNENNKETE